MYLINQTNQTGMSVANGIKTPYAFQQGLSSTISFHYGAVIFKKCSPTMKYKAVIQFAGKEWYLIYEMAPISMIQRQHRSRI